MQRNSVSHSFRFIADVSKWDMLLTLQIYVVFKIWKTNVSCQPGDQHLDSCSSTDGVNRCPSQQYASVVCSNSEPHLGMCEKEDRG